MPKTYPASMAFLQFLTEFGLHQSVDFVIHNRGNILERIKAAERLDSFALHIVLSDNKSLNLSYCDVLTFVCPKHIIY